MLRYTSLNGGREAALGQYPSMTLAEARLESSKMQRQLQQGE
ncbi:Arm DNA-binding domain-containing protein [Thiosulfatimonas sediminis]|nr:Arm DNA-binding domain-containing protein [Thiosulfatimonas sediminis]